VIIYFRLKNQFISLLILFKYENKENYTLENNSSSLMFAIFNVYSYIHYSWIYGNTFTPFRIYTPFSPFFNSFCQVQKYPLIPFDHPSYVDIKILDLYFRDDPHYSNFYVFFVLRYLYRILLKTWLKILFFSSLLIIEILLN
jgi:hypothetical protein